jgi:hypothetical protein
MAASLTLTASPPQCLPARPAGWVNYTIQSGDTVSGLASSRGITIEQLLTANCLTDPRRIITGQTIFLPPAPQNASPTQGAGPEDTGGGANSNQDGNGSGSQNDNNGSDDHGGSNNNDDDNDDGSDDNDD